MTTIETKSTETKTSFISLCTFPFDPAKNSDCFVVCQIDNPEDFKRCEENFKIAPVAAKTKPKAVAGGLGKSKWGHINGTQAGLIDTCLVNADKPLSLAEISAFAQGRLPRVLHHLKHIVANRGAVVELTKDKCIYWAENPNMVALVSHGSVSSLVIRKTAEKKAPAEKKVAEKKAPAPAEKKVAEKKAPAKAAKVITKKKAKKEDK